MHFSRRHILVASTIGALASGRAAADVVNLVIKVELSSDRDQTGSLRLQTLAGATLAGPFSVYGRSDNSKAAAHGNPSRDPTKPYGDTPTGAYEIPRAIATGSSTSYASHSYGPNGALVLKPKTGQAATAASNGRVGLLIHSGDLGSGGKLRATHGCLRLSNSGHGDAHGRNSCGRRQCAVRSLRIGPHRCDRRTARRSDLWRGCRRSAARNRGSFEPRNDHDPAPQVVDASMRRSWRTSIKQSGAMFWNMASKAWPYRVDEALNDADKIYLIVDGDE